jgi:hypothetical protein
MLFSSQAAKLLNTSNASLCWQVHSNNACNRPHQQQHSGRKAAVWQVLAGALSACVQPLTDMPDAVVHYDTSASS